MKTFRLVFFVAVFTLLGATWSRVSAQDDAAKTSPPAHGVSSGTQNPTHPVLKGDTLWRITQSAYGDPFLWPSLWEVNKSTVSNPHLIYPGQVLVVPSKEDIRKIKITGRPPMASASAVAPSAEKISASPSAREVSAPSADSVETAVSSPEPAPASETPAVPAADEPASPSVNEPPAPTVRAPAVESSLESPAPEISSSEAPATILGHPRRDARIVEASFSPDGVVAGVKEDKLLVSQGDIVYLDFPFVKPVVGKRMGIYRKMGRVRNPSDGRHMGEEIVRMGTLEIIETSSEGGAAAARILTSRDPVKIKDWVLVEK